MRKPLPKLSTRLRPYQREAVESGLSLIQSNPQDWHLFVSPTGTGKSLVELHWLNAIPNSILVTPRIEIISGMLDKLGHVCDTLTDIIEMGSRYGLYTPIRLRNLLSAGKLPFQPEAIVLDEAHHQLADSWQDIQMYLNGIPVLGMTATPYRGTPDETEKFRKQWGSINYCISLAESVNQNFCSLPTSEVWPMIDDDLIEVVNGEIKISSCTSLIKSKVDDIADKCKQFYSKELRLWDRPTMFSVPSGLAAIALAKALHSAGLSATTVTQDTKRKDRVIAFEKVVNCQTALVQIDVISEGVDLPIRRLIDVKPTLSPVKWLQQVGRITRPIGNEELAPEYICLCRNLERHCYLMEGLIPMERIRAAQNAFIESDPINPFSKRSGSRAVGLEGLGKFVTTPIHLLNGITAFAYSLASVEQWGRTDVFILVHPGSAEPLRAIRTSARLKDAEMRPDGEYGPMIYSWGNWKLTDTIPDLKGCSSAKPGRLTEKQQAWWLRSAESYGLNPHKEVNARSFQILPLLKDLRIKL